MTGLARWCLQWPLLWAAAAYAAYRYGGMPWLAVLSGLLFTIAVACCVSLGRTIRERALLRGGPPEEGAWVAVSGSIHSMDPLRAPFSGAECVAYHYRIYLGKTVLYDGKALAPSTIATRHGSVRLLAVPFLDLPAQTIAGAAEKARQFIDATAFESVTVEQEATDDDGVFRRDKEYHGPVADLSRCTFEERHIRQGETVCAFGLYSHMRGGLIPHPDWSKHTTLMRGSAEEVAGQLGRRMVKLAVAAIACGAAAAALVALTVY